MADVVVAFGGDGPMAGADHMAWNTALQLARRGHRVVALTSRTACAGAGIEVVHPAAVAADGRGIPWRPDVVHAFDLAHPATVELAWRVAHACGSATALTPATDRSLWPDDRLGRRVCASADVVFALTGVETDTLVRAGAGAERIVRVGQGPQLTDRADAAAFRRRHAMSGPIVLFLGRHTRAKGYPALLRAARHIWPAVPAAELVFVGPAGHDGVVDEFAACADPRIRRLGAVSAQEKHDALAACDVLCLPSIADVFPLVFVEAWSCGKPVVSGDFPGARQVVRDGVDGLVVPPRPDVLADALVSLLTDEPRRTAMGAEGRARAAADLTWSAVGAQVEAAYAALARAAHDGARP